MPDRADVPSPTHRSLHTRRGMLRLALFAGGGALGLALVSCTPSSSGSSTAAPTTAPSQGSAAGSSEWDSLVAAAKKEGKVVVSGPPAPDARTKLPEAFKARYGIDMEYLGGNTSQLASRIESERAANQYTIDVSMSGPDTAYGTFIPNKWLDPIKPALILPEVTDPSAYAKGGPSFRDPSGEMTMQIFNSISPIGYINTSVLQASEVPSTDALIDPKLKGKIASYDPSVNGGGLIFGSVLYVTRGQDFATKFYQGQEVAYTRDYQQIADWVAHGSYGIGIGATPIYVAQYAGAVPLEMFKLSDIKTIVAGGYGIISLFNQAPHPNAAKVFVNWIASKEGVTTYGTIDGSAPIRTDVQPTWMDQDLVPQPGGDYFDVYDYTYVTDTRQKVAKIYASLKGS